MCSFAKADRRAVLKASKSHRMMYVIEDTGGDFHTLCALRKGVRWHSSYSCKRLVEILAVDELGEITRWIPDE